jgi:hypothetical protein
LNGLYWRLALYQVKRHLVPMAALTIAAMWWGDKR